MFISAAQHPAQTMTVVLIERTFSRRFVQAGSLKDETDFIQRSVHSKVIHFAQRQIHSLLFRLFTACILPAEKDVTIPGYIYKGGMPACYNGGSLVFSGLTTYFYIEFLRNILFQRYVDALLSDKAFTLIHSSRIAVFQHFQLIFRLAHQCPQRYGNGQSNHTRTGNPHPHCVFQDIGA